MRAGKTAVGRRPPRSPARGGWRRHSVCPPCRQHRLRLCAVCQHQLVSHTDLREFHQVIPPLVGLVLSCYITTVFASPPVPLETADSRSPVLPTRDLMGTIRLTTRRLSAGDFKRGGCGDGAVGPARQAILRSRAAPAQGRAGRVALARPHLTGQLRNGAECLPVPHRHGRAGLAILTYSPPGAAIIRRHDRIDCPVAIAA